MNEYAQDFRVENDVLYVRLSGRFPLKLLDAPENLFQPLMQACAAQNCARALIDARDLQANLDTLGLFRAGKDAALLDKHGLRVALLAREDMRDVFFDQVVFNRGGKVGIFTDLESARHWLQG